MNRVRVAAVLILPVAALAAACSSDGGGSGGSGGGGAFVQGGSSAPSASPAPGKGGLPSAATLRTFLVTQADLPAGYTQDPPSASKDPSDSSGPKCALMPGGGSHRDNHVVDAKASFTLGSGITLQSMEFDIYGYGPQHTAQQTMRDAHALATTCPTATWTENGLTYDMQLANAPAPRLGDDAVAVRLSLTIHPPTGQAVQAGGGLVAVRKGDLIFLDETIQLSGQGSVADGTLLQKELDAYSRARSSAS